MDIEPVKQLDAGFYCIDLELQGEAGIVSSYLVDDGSEAALVETGPSSSSDVLWQRLQAIGVPPERITHLVLTHIHLDHAGAAGLLLRRLPNAHVVVHPRGAPHLADPERLLKSAARIYGDRMSELWGKVVPVPEDRIRTVGDGEVVRVAGRLLRAIDTPGHATHHYAWYDVESRGVFTGDVAGISLSGSTVVRPPTPPPEIDLEAWAWSVSRLRALSPRRLYLTHFGVIDDAHDHLDRFIAALHRWAGRVEAWVDAGLERDEIAERLGRFAEEELRVSGASDELVRLYDLAIDHGMIADGLLRALARPALA